jgi:hypothetical protein
MRTRKNGAGEANGAQGRNRTTDTVIFSHVTVNIGEQEHTPTNLRYLLFIGGYSPLSFAVVHG